jgi:hypothetical protein
LPIKEQGGETYAKDLSLKLESYFKDWKWCIYNRSPRLTSKLKDDVTIEELRGLAEKTNTGALIFLKINHKSLNEIELGMEIVGEDGEIRLFENETSVTSPTLESLYDIVLNWLDIYSKEIPFDARVIHFQKEYLIINSGKDFDLKYRQLVWLYRPIEKNAEGLWKAKYIGTGKVINVFEDTSFLWMNPNALKTSPKVDDWVIFEKNTFVVPQIGQIVVQKRDDLKPIRERPIEEKPVEEEVAEEPIEEKPVEEEVAEEPIKEKSVEKEKEKPKISEKEKKYYALASFFVDLGYGSEDIKSTMGSKNFSNFMGGFVLRGEVRFLKTWWAALDFNYRKGTLKSDRPLIEDNSESRNSFRLRGGYQFSWDKARFKPKLDAYIGWGAYNYKPGYIDTDGPRESKVNGFLLGVRGKGTYQEKVNAFIDFGTIFSSDLKGNFYVPGFDLSFGGNYMFLKDWSFDGLFAFIKSKVRGGVEVQSIDYFDFSFRFGPTYYF